MDDGVRVELERLRARAYGPHADIADDPTALARLHDLEEVERVERVTPVPAPVSDPAPAGVEADADLEDEDEDEDEDDDGDAAPTRNRGPLLRSTRTVWAWALSLALVTALASAATALGLTFAPVPVSAGAPQVDTLVEAPDAPLPAIFGQRTGADRAYADYFGVTAFAGYAQIDASDNRAPCLYLLDTDEVGQDETNGFRGNFVYGDCGAGIFPATVQFVVADGMPASFVERFPIGTNVQFVFDGENVGVFSDRG